MSSSLLFLGLPLPLLVLYFELSNPQPHEQTETCPEEGETVKVRKVNMNERESVQQEHGGPLAKPSKDVREADRGTGAIRSA